MIFDRNEQKQVVALLGAGSMGTAIVRRIGAGKKRRHWNVSVTISAAVAMM